MSQIPAIGLCTRGVTPSKLPGKSRLFFPEKIMLFYMATKKIGKFVKVWKKHWDIIICSTKNVMNSWICSWDVAFGNQTWIAGNSLPSGNLT